jgi:hypothetical protein
MSSTIGSPTQQIETLRMEAERETNMVKKHLKLAEYYTLLEGLSNHEACRIEEHLAPGRQNRGGNEKNDTCMPVSFWYNIIKGILNETQCRLWEKGDPKWMLDDAHGISCGRLVCGQRKIIYPAGLVDSVISELDYEIELESLPRAMEDFEAEREGYIIDKSRYKITKEILSKRETDVNELLAKLATIPSSFGAARRFSASGQLEKLQLAWQSVEKDV